MITDHTNKRFCLSLGEYAKLCIAWHKMDNGNTRSSESTWKMRSELEERGLKPSSNEEKKRLAVQFCEWLMALFPNLQIGMAWLKVFRGEDRDNSGLLNYDEVKRVVRHRFKIRKRDFSDEQLRMLWCALDEDDSDSVQLVEFGRFIKRARGFVPVATPRVGSTAQTQSSSPGTRVRRLPPYDYQGDASRWSLLPLWPRGPDSTPRPKSSYETTTFAWTMQAEAGKAGMEAPGRSAEMSRAHSKIRDIMSLIDRAQTAAQTLPTGQSRRTEKALEENAKPWLPVIHKEWASNNQRLRDCKNNNVALQSFMKGILDRTNHWTAKDISTL